MLIIIANYAMLCFLQISTCCRDGRFLIGDEIINVNGASLRGVTMEEARHILGTCGPEIDIIVARELQESVRAGAQVRYPDNLPKHA